MNNLQIREERDIINELRTNKSHGFTCPSCEIYKANKYKVLYGSKIICLSCLKEKSET